MEIGVAACHDEPGSPSGVNNLLELDVAADAFSGTPLKGKIESYWYE